MPESFRDPDWLLGRTFGTAFTVVSVDDDADRTVTLWRFDGHYKFSLAELQTAIESGFVVELPDWKGAMQ